MKNELMNKNFEAAPITLKLEGNPAATAIGYVVLGITTLGICAMFRGYALDFEKLHLTPAT